MRIATPPCMSCSAWRICWSRRATPQAKRNCARSSISLRTAPSPIVSNSWKRGRRRSRRRRSAQSPPARLRPKTSRHWLLQNPARSSARLAHTHRIRTALQICTHCVSAGFRRSLACLSAHYAPCHPSRSSCGARQRKPQTALQFKGRWRMAAGRMTLSVPSTDMRALGLLRRRTTQDSRDRS